MSFIINNKELLYSVSKMMFKIVAHGLILLTVLKINKYKKFEDNKNYIIAGYSVGAILAELIIRLVIA